MKPPIWTWGVGPWVSPNAEWNTTTGLYGMELIIPGSGTSPLYTTPTRELLVPTSRSINLKLWQPGEASFTITVPIHLTPRIKAGETDLWIHRNGFDVFRGRIDHLEVSASTESTTITVRTIDYRGLFQRQPSGVKSLLRIPAGTSIVQALYLYAWPAAVAALGLDQNIPDADLLGNTTEEVTLIPSESAWKSTQNILQASNLFDFWIDSNLRINLVKKRGEDKGAVIDFGGNLNSFSWVQEMEDYANVIYQEGASALPMLVAMKSADTYPEGQWVSWFNDDKADSLAKQTVAAKAHLDELSLLRPTYTAGMRPGGWGGPSNIWLGDIVKVYARVGEMLEDSYARVHGIDITLDENNQETVTLTLHRPKRSTRRKLQEIWTQHQKLNKPGAGSIYYG